MHGKDTKKVCDNSCTTCRYEYREYDEIPCTDCVRGDGDDEMWEAKPENPLDRFECCIMDSGEWEDFMNGKLAVILRDRKDFNDFMNHCEKRGIVWISGASAKSFLPDPMVMNKVEPIAIDCFNNPKRRMRYSSDAEVWAGNVGYKYILYGGALAPGGDENEPEQPQIKDSGERREFESGAVRDICEGKGRCDLMPLDMVASYMNDLFLTEVASFTQTHHTQYLSHALGILCDNYYGGSPADMMLDLAVHFEEGAKKYGERNWEKGLPIHCYIDSGVRHYFKVLRGDDDEPHLRSCVWNLICALWTMHHKPAMDDLPKREETDND